MAARKQTVCFRPAPVVTIRGPRGSEALVDFVNTARETQHPLSHLVRESLEKLYEGPWTTTPSPTAGTAMRTTGAAL